MERFRERRQVGPESEHAPEMWNEDMREQKREREEAVVATAVIRRRRILELGIASAAMRGVNPR